MSILTALQITKKVARLTADLAALRRRVVALECPPRTQTWSPPVPTEEPDPEAAARRKKRR